MKKIIITCLTLLLITSCGDTDKEIIKGEMSPYKKGALIGEDQEARKNAQAKPIEVIDEIEDKKNEWEEISETGIKYGVLGEDFYVTKNSKKIIIDEVCGKIDNVDFINDFIIYDWECTHGSMKRIYNLKDSTKKKGILFGKLTSDKKYIHSCQKFEAGVSAIQLFDINRNKFYDYGKDIGIGGSKSVINCEYTNDSMSFDILTKQNNGTNKEIEAYTVMFDNGELINKDKNVDLLETEEIKLSKEDQVALIENYYQLITDKELEKAYNLKYEPNKTLEEFKHLYRAIRIDQHLKIKKIKVNKTGYELYIHIENYTNAIVERYFVQMEIIGNKLKTISSIKKDKDIISSITYGDKTAYIEFDRGHYRLYLETNSEKKLIDELEKFIDRSYGPTFVDSFSLYQFIDEGNILAYIKQSSTHLYSLKHDKIHFVSVGERYGISEDKKYVYIDSSPGYFNSAGKIINYSDFSLYKEFLEKDIDFYVPNMIKYDPYNRETK